MSALSPQTSRCCPLAEARLPSPPAAAAATHRPPGPLPSEPSMSGLCAVSSAPPPQCRPLPARTNTEHAHCVNGMFREHEPSEPSAAPVASWSYLSGNIHVSRKAVGDTRENPRDGRGRRGARRLETAGNGFCGGAKALLCAKLRPL